MSNNLHIALLQPRIAQPLRGRHDSHRLRLLPVAGAYPGALGRKLPPAGTMAADTTIMLVAVHMARRREAGGRYTTALNATGRAVKLLPVAPVLLAIQISVIRVGEVHLLMLILDVQLAGDAAIH